MAPVSDEEDNDLPESVSFSTGKERAVKQFQQSIKIATARKQQLSLRRKKIQQRNKEQKNRKEKLLLHCLGDDDERSKIKRSVRSHLLETENTIFNVSTIDNHTERAKDLATKASMFRLKQLQGKRIRREPSKSWLNKRRKQNVGRRQPT